PTSTPTSTPTSAPILDDNKDIVIDDIPLAEGVSIEVAESAIISSDSDEGPVGTVYGKLQAKLKKASKNSITLSWKKVSGAKYVIYGNKCGKKNGYKKIATISKNSFTHKKLKKNTYYKYIIVAVKDGKVASASKSIHIATKGGKNGNTKKVVLNKKKATIKKGKKYKIKAKQKAESSKIKVKKHRALSFESSDENVVTVSKSGKAEAIGKGTAYIYVYAQDGVMAKIRIKVK
ncbi:MAG TPA: hypothetical protein DEO83_06650, partial [Lachnospiraceae bacterium]|nr:hypothetical protein [Lachnospiraceae bacterium]